MLLTEYYELIDYFYCITGITSLLISLNSIFDINDESEADDESEYMEKITAYECGFQSFEYSISNFDIKFYIIAVLFLIFDLELIFFLPFILTLNFISIQGLFSIIFFFVLLIFGFFYEWKLKILNFSEISHEEK